MVSIEYYMETVRAGRTEPWYMLDNAEACLSVLQETLQRLRDQQDTATEATDAPPPVDEEPAAEQKAPPATDVLSAPVVATDAEHLDPELLELFIDLLLWHGFVDFFFRYGIFF